MNSDNQLVVFCENDGQYRIYCHNCDKFCTERFHKNHLKSHTHTKNSHKREQLNKSFQLISQY